MINYRHSKASAAGGKMPTIGANIIDRDNEVSNAALFLRAKVESTVLNLLVHLHHSYVLTLTR